MLEGCSLPNILGYLYREYNCQNMMLVIRYNLQYGLGTYQSGMSLPPLNQLTDPTPHYYFQNNRL